MRYFLSSERTPKNRIEILKTILIQCLVHDSRIFSSAFSSHIIDKISSSYILKNENEKVKTK